MQFDHQFDKKAAQYINTFKKIGFITNNNLDNKSLDEMQVILIDVLSLPSTVPHNENFEVFFTLLDFPKRN